jgi:hypothetical protein
LHRAAQALCSSAHIAAVKAGFVSVGVAIVVSDVAMTRFDFWGGSGQDCFLFTVGVVMVSRPR